MRKIKNPYITQIHFNVFIHLQLRRKHRYNRSTTAVRKYKRASDGMSANVSHILDPPKPTQENCPILQEISDNSATPGKRPCTDREGVICVLPVDSDSRTVDRDGGKVYNNSVSNPLLFKESIRK